MDSLQKSSLVIIFAIVMFMLKVYMGGGWCHSEARIDGKTVIVTGANTGIGKETALDLVKRGGRLILACRSVQRGEEAATDIRHQLNLKDGDDNLIVMKLDLSSLASVREFVVEFKNNEKRLDILINNAGVYAPPQPTTEDGFETTFGVNHLGHFLLKNLLLEDLKKSAPSRIVSVSALGHKFTQNGGIDFDDLMSEKSFSSHYAYAQSKLANVMFSYHLGKKLKGTGVTTYSLHPGVIRTEIGRYLLGEYLQSLLYVLTWPFVKSSSQGAQTQICCAVEEYSAGETGRYYSDCVETEAAKEAINDKTARKLWDISAKLVKL